MDHPYRASSLLTLSAALGFVVRYGRFEAGENSWFGDPLVGGIGALIGIIALAPLLKRELFPVFPPWVYSALFVVAMIGEFFLGGTLCVILQSFGTFHEPWGIIDVI